MKKGFKFSEETRKKMSIAHTGIRYKLKHKRVKPVGKHFVKGEDPRRFGKGAKHSLESRLKMSVANKGVKKPKLLNSNRSYKTALNLRIRMSPEYALWRKSVYARDKWTCVWCGYRGRKLNADHIKPFALFPELRFAIDNGRTLCVPCHQKTDTFGGRMSRLKS